MTTQDPNDQMQEVDIFQTRVLGQLMEISQRQAELKEAVRTLTDTLAVHVKQNIETFQKINDYIGEQMSYRLFRQGLEENNLTLELEKKKLELEYAQKRFETLEEEHEEATEEKHALLLEREKQKLEIEGMRKNLELLQDAKHSTKDRIASIASRAPVNPLHTKMKETLILTALGTMTAAGVGGILAFIVFFVRFYIMNNP